MEIETTRAVIMLGGGTLAFLGGVIPIVYKAVSFAHEKNALPLATRIAAIAIYAIMVAAPIILVQYNLNPIAIICVFIALVLHFALFAWDKSPMTRGDVIALVTGTSTLLLMFVSIILLMMLHQAETALKLLNKQPSSIKATEPSP